MFRQLQRFVLRVGYRLLRTSWRLRHPVTLGVRLLLIEDGKILLVKHTYRPGCFCLEGDRTAVSPLHKRLDENPWRRQV